MTTPEVFFSDPDDASTASEELARALNELEVEDPFVLASRHGMELARALKPSEPAEAPQAHADQLWAEELGSRAHRSGADTIVAIGGGRCLDVAKLAAARAGLTLVVVPTQLSHDGICSPVAVVPDASGRSESLGAIVPRAVFLSLPTLMSAPAGSVAAGIGDLMANPLALRDWALASDRGLEAIDRAAWDMSLEAYRSIEDSLARDIDALARDAGFIRRLANALVASGLAMIASGTSRPASGGEHEISHAIDHLYGGRALHGAQVAFGCIISTALYDEDTAGSRERAARLGLPHHHSQLGLDRNAMIEVLLEAPRTRPGRFTIVEAADLDEAAAGALVDRIWS